MGLTNTVEAVVYFDEVVRASLVFPGLLQVEIRELQNHAGMPSFQGPGTVDIVMVGNREPVRGLYNYASSLWSNLNKKASVLKGVEA